MFKRTLRLLQEVKKTETPLKDKHQKILDFYTPNDHLVEKAYKMPYELRGEYLPRTKINPYRKTPMNVIYNYQDFGSYVLPSKRDQIYGAWGFEELFGVKRWRNDSPFMREYIKVDNQIFAIVILSLVLLGPVFFAKQRKLEKNQDDYITSGYGKFTAGDLV